MFEPGFAVTARLVNFLYKGTIFAGIGMAAGLGGTFLSNGLLALRCKLDPSYVNKVGWGWGGHFGGFRGHLWCGRVSDSAAAGDAPQELMMNPAQ